MSPDTSDADQVVFDIDSNGFQISARYTKDALNEVIIPLADGIEDVHVRNVSPTVVFLAAPGGTGKTTLSKVLERIHNERHDSVLTAVGIDGFHHKNAYLESNYVDMGEGPVPLKSMKGFYNTYDCELLHGYLERFKSGRIERWPTYSRLLHDVVDESLEISGDIILLEGNWLLDRDPGWADLRTFCDYSIFISSPEPLLRERLISRKIRGGLTPEEALDFYINSDSKGVRRVLDSHEEADVTLVMDETGNIMAGDV